MGKLLKKKRGLDESLQLVANLREDRDKAVAQKPLPRRWVPLIHHLDAQERQQEGGSTK